MMERKDFNFPPFSRIIELTVKDRFEDRADRMSARLAADLRALLEPSGCPVLQSMVTGPYAPVVDKVADMHIRSIRLSLKKDRNLASSKSAIMAAVHKFEKSQKYDGHITLNVDPS
jgi:primosomal protein N' (replication factor Y)